MGYSASGAQFPMRKNPVTNFRYYISFEVHGREKYYNGNLEGFEETFAPPNTTVLGERDHENIRN